MGRAQKRIRENEQRVHLPTPNFPRLQKGFKSEVGKIKDFPRSRNKVLKSVKIVHQNTWKCHWNCVTERGERCRALHQSTCCLISREWHPRLKRAKAAAAAFGIRGRTANVN